ncbi:MAG: hypothetical protein AAB221_07725 [Bacteroidota bacterium]
MASSLRRSVHHSVLCAAIITICLIACKNPAAEQRKILNAFDSVNKALERIDSLLAFSKPVYDSLMDKAWEDNNTQQMYYTVHDFHGYLYDLKSRFETFLGDSIGQGIPEQNQGDPGLSDAFFKEKRNDPESFLKYFHIALNRLKPFTQDAAKSARIDDLITTTPVNRAEELFNAGPPVSVIIMINYYDLTLKSITQSILQEYFKKQ